MISASKEILEYNINYTRYLSDDEDTIIPSMIAFRRTHKSICKICKTTFNNIGPEMTKNNIICFFCSTDIETKSFYYYYSLQIKKKLYKEIIPNILKEIREIGMHPDRIYQTQLFEYYTFRDLQCLKHL